MDVETIEPFGKKLKVLGRPRHINLLLKQVMLVGSY